MSPRIEEVRETISICAFDGSPEACKALHRAGDSIQWHCLMVISVATRGYSIDFSCGMEVELCVNYTDVT